MSLSYPFSRVVTDDWLYSINIVCYNISIIPCSQLHFEDFGLTILFRVKHICRQKDVQINATQFLILNF